ncbi:MAG: FAD-dependent oxidoreductase [Solobacterium sp.]|nr:FAD-dependent oxidoreductase [Solobacterium sp.]
MNRFAKGLFAAMLLIGMTGCSAASSAASSAPVSSLAEETGIYTPGTYEATGKGMGGDVTVRITVDASHITDVSVDVSGETKGYGADHQADFESQIKEADGGEIDGVSGCSITTNAIREAMNKALAQAKGEEIPEETAQAAEADVIVIGAGGAGLAAAAAAADAGASVIVLEANGFAGGATMTSGGNFLNINPDDNKEADRNDAALEKYASYKAEDFPEVLQPRFEELLKEIEEYKNNGEEKGAFDSVNMVLIDHFLNGDGYDLDGNRVSLDFDLIIPAFENYDGIRDMLTENGMKIKPGATAGKHFSSPEGGGKAMIDALLKAAEKADIQYNVKATELVVTDGKVTGVKAIREDGDEVEYHANKGVVIATGGYTSNTKMVAETQRMYTGLNENNPSNQPATIQGDGILMAQKLGAGTKDMSFITTMLKGYQNLATSGEEATIYGAAQLAVNINGERFIDDKPASGPAAAVRYALNDQPEGIMYAIGDQKMIDAMNASKEGMADDMIARGMAWQADTLEDAASAAGLDPEAVKKTVETFNGYVDAGKDDDFGRTEFNGKVEEGPVYIAKLQSAYHLTFGGLTVDGDTHVLDTDGKVIPGLYAAGDVVGNFEGDIHQSGYCLTVVLNSGLVAGKTAAAE